MEGNMLLFAQSMTVIVISTAGFVVIGLGARILWRWGSAAELPKAFRQDGDARTRHLETAVDAIAIEVERISEAQRFMVTLLAESLPERRAERAGELASPEHARRVITPH